MKNRKIIHVINGSGQEFDGISSKERLFEVLLSGYPQATCLQLSRVSNKYELESWRFAKRSVYRKWKHILPVEKHGIKFDLVPLSFPFNFLFEYNLIRKIWNETKNNNVLLHIYRYHEIPFLNIIFFLRKLPIIGAHLGYSTRGNMSFFEKLVFKNVDYFFVETDAEEDYLSKIVGSRRVRYRVTTHDIHYFHPSNKLESRKKLGLPLDNKILLFVGRFTTVKGVDILLDSLRLLNKDFKDWTLVMVGGSESNDLYDLVYDSDMPIVKKPAVKKEILASYYNAADVFVLPSRMEGTSAVIIESLLCDLPVIFTDVGGNAKLISQNNTGICIPSESPNNPEKIRNDLANAIRFFFKNNDKFKDMRKILLNRYSLVKDSLLTIRLYDKLYSQYYGSD